MRLNGGNVKPNERTLQLLADYSGDQAELLRLSRCGALNPKSHLNGPFVELKARLSQASFPDRQTVEATCLEDLNCLAEEVRQLRVDWLAALRLKLERHQAEEAARVAIDVQRYGAVVDHQAALKILGEAEAAHQAASKRCDEIEVTRRRISDYVQDQYPGCELTALPATFPPFALARVDRLLGEYFKEAERTAIFQRLGIDPLALLAR